MESGLLCFRLHPRASSAVQGRLHRYLSPGYQGWRQDGRTRLSGRGRAGVASVAFGEYRTLQLRKTELRSETDLAECSELLNRLVHLLRVVSFFLQGQVICQSPRHPLVGDPVAVRSLH